MTPALDDCQPAKVTKITRAQDILNTDHQMSVWNDTKLFQYPQNH